jgi:hypothetical protein
MIGDKIRRKLHRKDAIQTSKGLILSFQDHERRTYPYTEEDSEGIITYFSSKHAEMTFKGISPREGYEKTINKFKLIKRIHKTRITLEGDKVVVDF